MSDLIQRCKEVLEWANTGNLTGTVLRQYALTKWGDHPHALSLAEKTTMQEAMQALVDADIGRPPKVFMAYRCSHQWGGAYENGETRDTAYLIDADTDALRLTRRVNAHFAKPDVVRSERGTQHEIPAFAMKSDKKFGTGGGCDYHAWLEIREAPTLKE